MDYINNDGFSILLSKYLFISNKEIADWNESRFHYRRCRRSQNGNIVRSIIY